MMTPCLVVASGQALVSVSTIGMQPELSDAQLADTVKAELASWFAAGEVATWQLLRIYRIPFAQPNQVRFCDSTQTHIYCP